MHSFLRNVAIGLLRPERLVFKDAAPESRKPVEAPGASISPEGAFDQLMRDLDTFANALDNPTRDQIRKELERANEANKGEVYNKICSILDPKLIGMRPELLDSVHRGLGEKIEAYVAIKEGRGARIEASRQAQISLADETEKREELSDQSPPEAYLETFKNSPKIQGIAVALELGKRSGNPGGSFNFERWPADALAGDHQRVASYFTEIGFPRGKGRNAFINGFLTNDPNSEDFRRSHQVLVGICAHLEEYIDTRVKERADAKKVENRPTVGFTINDAANNLKDTWKQAKGWDEKGAFLVAAGAVLWMAWSMKDDNFPGTETKWKDVCKYAIGFLSINYLSGKVSKDKRTLTQRLLDVRPDIDDFEKDENRLKGFAQKHGMRENQDVLHTFLRLQDKDVKTLFPLYQAAIDRGEEEISQNDIRGLGFYRGEIDGKTAFKVIDDLVDDTAINWGKAEAISSGKLTEGADLTADDKKRWTQKWYKLDAFQKKYIVHGADERGLADHAVTFGQAVQNEITIEEAKRINEFARKQKLTERGYEKIVAGLKWTYEKVKEYGIIAGGWIAEKAGQTYNFSKNEVVIPFGQWAKAHYEKYKPYVATPLKEALAHYREKDLLKVLPPDFNAKATSPTKATVMGWPGIDFTVLVRKDGKDVVVVDNAEFLIDDGIPGNKTNADSLAAKIQKNVDDLVASKNIPQFKGKKVEWDPANGKWVIKGASVNADTQLGIPATATDIAFTIDSDRKTLHFFVLNTKFEENEVGDIDKKYRDSFIENQIWTDTTYLKGLPVTIDKVETKPAAYPSGTLITGKIAGLKFQAVLKNPSSGISGGINFFDGTSSGGAEKLKIDQTNGGPEFLAAYTKMIDQDPYFRDTFLVLQSQMENADEGALQRLYTMNKTKLWIIPTNVKGLLAGPVMEKQWAYTLQYKRFETLDMFEHSLQGQPVSEVPKMYARWIEGSVKELSALSSDLGEQKPEQRADHFQASFDRLETINYPNDAYRALFKEYKDMIDKYRGKLDGFEGTDWSVSDKSYEIYQILMRVWSRHTRDHAVQDGDPVRRGKIRTKAPPGNPMKELSPETTAMIRTSVINKVRMKLDLAAIDPKTKTDRTITKANLPKSETEADLDKWIL